MHLTGEYVNPFSGVVLTTRYSQLHDALESSNTAKLPVAFMEQTHSNEWALVDSTAGTHNYRRVDALITDSNCVLVVRTADCLPIFISHSSGWRAAIHAGRRGTLGNITQIVLSELCRRITESGRFHIWFGPCICNLCYQIDWDTDTHFDLVSENIRQINDVLGPNNYQLVDVGHCTSCRNDLFFSYRKEATSERIYSIWVPPVI
ncbi:laccase domain-containing protein [bacterium]|nr:laccase domain-containing protein [bacterium]